MVIRNKYTIALIVVLIITLSGCSCSRTKDPLSSWNEGPAKNSIIEFVDSVTDKSNPDYVLPAERIATFDNDGTLWTERPIYFQLLFAIDRVRQLAVQHPEWAVAEPFKVMLEEGPQALDGLDERQLIQLLMATHADITTEEFTQIVKDWLATAQHPRFNRPYTELVYQPMLELLDYLRANEFKTYIVSGGGIEFMRPWVEEIYGIPPEQVVGSSIKTKLEMRDGKPVLLRLPEINFINDKEGKLIGINQFIGRRPIAAFGNSDGDMQMLQWTAAGNGKRLMLLVHHTDAQREYAYDRDSHIGKLDKALDAAQKNGWTVVDMQKDWKVIYPAE